MAFIFYRGPGSEPFVFQMKVCMDEFRSLAARYADLHQSSFDADYATLRNVELYPKLGFSYTSVTKVFLFCVINATLTHCSDNNRAVCSSPT